MANLSEGPVEESLDHMLPVAAAYATGDRHRVRVS